MGVDTCGILKRTISPKKMLQFIKDEFDITATSIIRKHSYDNKPMGSIYFKDENDNRGLFYCQCNDIESYGECLDLVKKYADKNNYFTCISLRAWGNSVEIMKKIVSHFGGLIDETDCDDKSYYEIKKIN